MRTIGSAFLMVLLIFVAPLLAQAPSAPVPDPAKPVASPPEKPAEATIESVASKEGVALGKEIVVKVKEYEKLRNDAAAAGKPVTLFLNGVDMGITPSYDRRDTREFTFILTRTADNLPLWRTLLRDPFCSGSETATVSVGIKGGRALARAEGAKTDVQIQKTDWHPLAVLGWLVFFVLVIAGILYFARSFLKNDHNDRYSLGRTQLAWWFILILASYIFIWLLTGDRDTITGSVLVLLGISAATTMASSMINSTVQERRAEKLATLAAHAAAIPPAAAAGLARQAAVVTNAMNPGQPPRFFHDLISDDAGRPALHRYQIVVWTIVLGVFFVYSVCKDLTMPQFSDTLLALMGISAGTYIGVKAPAV